MESDGLTVSHNDVSNTLKQFAQSLRVDPKTQYTLSDLEGSISAVSTRPGKLKRIGFTIDAKHQPTRDIPNRITVLAEQGGVVIGGITYVIRY